MTKHNTIRFKDNINITVVIYYTLKFQGKMSVIPLIDVKNVLIKCNTELFWWSSVESPPASAGDTGSIPAPGRSHMPQSNWAHALWSPRATTTEPTGCNYYWSPSPKACATQQEEPLQWEAPAPQHGVAPSYANREKAHTQQWRPSTAKNQINKSFFKI